MEAQSCTYNESSQAFGDDLESQLSGEELSSINTSEIENALEESKEPSKDSCLGKRLASSTS